MVNQKHIVLGVHITNRAKSATELQHLLTEYGCNIKTRLGLHEVHENHCATSGLILLELTGKVEETNQLITKIKSLAGVDLQKMEFHHD